MGRMPPSKRLQCQGVKGLLAPSESATMDATQLRNVNAYYKEIKEKTYTR